MPNADLGQARDAITEIERTFGTGAAGTVDTYSVWTETHPKSGGVPAGTFQVRNGANGSLAVKQEIFGGYGQNLSDLTDWIDGDSERAKRIVSMVFVDLSVGPCDIREVSYLLDLNGNTFKFFKTTASSNNQEYIEITSLGGDAYIYVYYYDSVEASIDTELNASSTRPVENAGIVEGISAHTIVEEFDDLDEALDGALAYLKTNVAKDVKKVFCPISDSSANHIAAVWYEGNFDTNVYILRYSVYNQTNGETKDGIAIGNTGSWVKKVNVPTSRTIAGLSLEGDISKNKLFDSLNVKGFYNSLSDLQTAYPSGNGNIYLVGEDCNWYYWDGAKWMNGGVYVQDMELNNISKNFVYISEIVQGSLQVASMVVDTSSKNGIACTQKISCVPGERIKVIMPTANYSSSYKYRYRFGWYKADGTVIGQNAMTDDNILTIPANSYYFSFGAYAYDLSNNPILDPVLFNVISPELIKVVFLDRYTSNIDKKIDKKVKSLFVNKKKLVTGTLQSAAFVVDSNALHAVTYLHKVPVSVGEMVKIVAPEFNDVFYHYRIVFYNSSETVIGQYASSIFDIIKIPSSCAFIAACCMAYDTSTGSQKQNFNLLSEMDDDQGIELQFLDRDESDYVTPDDLKEIINATDIVSLNKDCKDKLIQAKRRINLSSNAYLNNPQPVVLLHFSDIHGDKDELYRIMDFKNEYSDMIDDVICTGDMVELRYIDDFTYWNDVDGANETLLAIGNHDALADESGYDFTNLVTQQQQYDKFFAPNIASWNCTYQSGKTYYYKDYASKKLRLIVLNCMLTGQDATDQLSWLETTLAGAITNDYSVVIANHYMVTNAQKVPSNFTTLDANVSNSNSSLPETYLAKVNTFINNGGKFVCHLAGHTHNDFIVKSTTYTNQLCIVVDALSRKQGNQYSDTQRTDFMRCQDLANLFVIDTASHVIKIIRVGANQDHYLRNKNCITIDYTNGTILSQN